ncbi:hypothetical protein AZE42_08170 [Rhizopogon vesiculosus]|uniref:F-box domain-containing protein n=1 Tax=Rhizopogon vesiculosus TaxID=180088 RepID=A0A1J8R1F5_9AGAM|nr:hypothetical protein AZE42_08170 [Rhizopogon vesiculosus]
MKYQSLHQHLFFSIGVSETFVFSPVDRWEIPKPPYVSLNIPDLIGPLSTSFSRTLERISINFSYLDIISGLADPHLVLGFEAVAPLLSFNRLTELELNFFCTSAIDDAALKIMAQSWPQLEHFRFGGATKRLDLPLLTFRGLVYLIQHCRYLQVIEMCFSAFSIDTNCEPFSKTIPNENITSIAVGFSPIVNPTAVACQLHMLLPNLTRLRTTSNKLPPPFERNQAEWKEVEKLLVVFAKCAEMKDGMGQMS